MLTFSDKPQRYCDRVSRRSFIQIGATGIAGLGLADILRAEARSGIGSSNKSLINIHLGGGPSHQDMWDLKPDAPIEYRGEFSPIHTNVPGLYICEHFPKLATMADKFAVIRSLVGSVNEHSSNTVMTGYGRRSLEPVGGRPAIGSVMAKLCADDRHAKLGSPAFVSLMGTLSAGYLGPVFKPYVPDGRGRRNLKLDRSLSADRLGDRTKLLTGLDQLRRDIDASGDMQALDAFTQRAVDVVTSGKMAQALDLSHETDETRKRYAGNPQLRRSRDNDRFLTARRLVEAGVRCVAINWGGWDTHQKNFDALSQQLPALDAGLSALISDLDDRGMLSDVTIAVWGEFGRTPRVNSKAGRDHWPRLAGCFLAGGGMKTGQAVGASDRYAGEAADRPVHVHEIHSTLYHNLGVNPQTTQFMDPAGRPQYLLDHRTPLPELI